MHYQQKIDKIFANGSLWKHRTLRTLFDPFSSEYNLTTMDKKLEILQTIQKSGLIISEVIFDYK